MAFKYAWYQTSNKVFIDIFVKGATEGEVEIDLKKPDFLAVNIESEFNDFDLCHTCVGYKMSLSNIKATIELEKGEIKEWKALTKSDLRDDGNTLSYPTSAKRPMNWDAITEPDTLDDSKQDIDTFFKKIYEQGDENTRRAMLKSITESGGTVLSTNWSDVGKRKVERKPPASD